MGIENPDFEPKEEEKETELTPEQKVIYDHHQEEEKRYWEDRAEQLEKTDSIWT